MTSEDEIVVNAPTSFTEAQLDDLEVEFSKVESTLKALADDVDPSTVAGWLDQVEV
ncbi:MAG: hypothetical protein VX785_04860 [Actinomycetota bacterium]|nr:hypothetical protein [Acidimicrobiales bacterium]MEC8922121.1 hypothetical protein [Actinomycetota bacterium]MED5552019.1 hypothetical protein [Actinomycetota bacterium]MEE3140076.1 hypothetical protein [Actinomycetota bacterium]MEE3186545.1 hypothetical protein [Actinomycetota bacterium]